MASEKATKKSTASTTRRTLHYYWQVTRRHFGLFSLLMVSTFLFVALLSYGNPYVMSLIVDKVSAGPVSSDEVFSTFRPVHHRAHRHQRIRRRRQVSCRISPCTSCRLRHRTIWPR